MRTQTGYEKPVEIDGSTYSFFDNVLFLFTIFVYHTYSHLDVPYVDYPITIKILWKRDRTLRIDYKEKKLTIFEQTIPRLVISGKQLQRVCFYLSS